MGGWGRRHEARGASEGLVGVRSGRGDVGDDVVLNAAHTQGAGGQACSGLELLLM